MKRKIDDKTIDVSTTTTTTTITNDEKNNNKEEQQELIKKQKLNNNNNNNGNNNKKNPRRRGNRKKKECFDFLRTNTCKYGSECRYLHVRLDQKRIDMANREKIMNKNPKNCSYVARVFWQLYYPTDKNDPTNCKNDRYIFLHPNDIAMVGLAETHPIFKSNRIQVKYSNHSLNDKNIVADIKTSGKSKNGGIKCKPGDKFCTIIDLNDNNKEYEITSPLTGLLVEINSRLLKNPELLLTHPHSLGYLGIYQNAKRKKFNFSGCMEKKPFAAFKNLKVQEEIEDDQVVIHGNVSFRTLFRQRNFMMKTKNDDEDVCKEVK